MATSIFSELPASQTNDGNIILSVNGSATTSTSALSEIIANAGGGGTTYTAGDNIDITNDVISVTGLDVYITSADLINNIVKEYDPNKEYYRVGSLVMHDNQLYQAQANTQSGAFNPTYWSATNVDNVRVTRLTILPAAGDKKYPTDEEVINAIKSRSLVLLSEEVPGGSDYGMPQDIYILSDGYISTSGQFVATFIRDRHDADEYGWYQQNATGGYDCGPSTYTFSADLRTNNPGVWTKSFSNVYSIDSNFEYITSLYGYPISAAVGGEGGGTTYSAGPMIGINNNYIYVNNSACQGYSQYAIAVGGMTTAQGDFSHAEGSGTYAFGHCTHTEGADTTAYGDFSHAEGVSAYASNYATHAEGYTTTALGDYSHAEGAGTYTFGNGAHAEGGGSSAKGNFSHAEGQMNIANSIASHAEGFQTSAKGLYSHAEGYYTNTEYEGSHAEGCYTSALAYASHAEGEKTSAAGQKSHAEGWYCSAASNYTHAEGNSTLASGENSHAEGNVTIAGKSCAHAEGSNTSAIGDTSHAEGNYTLASAGIACHAECHHTSALGNYCHSEGAFTLASSYACHAEGNYTMAVGNYCHAEGANTSAGWQKGYSYAMGAHAEGYKTVASGNYSHAEGSATSAIGIASHSEGYCTIAKGEYSHAAGWQTSANYPKQFVIGQYNVNYSDSIFEIGYGTSDANRITIFRVDNNGNVSARGTFTPNVSM